jgi:hypothetical protein
VAPKVAKITGVPVAVASDGTVYVNVAHLGIDATKLLPHLPFASRVFIGVPLSRKEVKTLFAAADNSLEEGVAKIAFKRSRRSRKQ